MTSLTFEPIWPWMVAAPAVVLLLLMVLLTYPQRVRHLPPFTRRLLIGARLAAAVALSLAMLRPSLQFRETEQQPAILYVVTDSSRSMTVKDGPAGATRRCHWLSPCAADEVTTSTTSSDRSA